MDDYEMDSRVIDKLIEIETKILANYHLLFMYKETNNEKEKFVIEKIKILLKKENILLNQLPKDSYILGYVSSLVCQNPQNFFDSADIAEDVLKRFTGVMADLINLRTEKEELEQFGDEVDLDDVYNSSARINIRDNLIIKYIKCIDDIIFSSSDDLKPLLRKCQYVEAFHYKNVGDFLLDNNFDSRNISYRDDFNMINFTGLSIDDYVSLKNDELFNMAQDILFDLISEIIVDESEVNNLKIGFGSLKLKFLLREMPTPLLMTFDELISESIENMEEKKPLINDICGFVKKELNSRDDIPEKKAELNPLRTPVDEETVDSLIELIKLDEKMLLLFDNIDFDDPDNGVDIRNLEILVAREKELVNKIDINYRNARIIEEMLSGDLDFFLIEENEVRQARKKELIYERIHDLLPFYQKLELSPIQSQVSYSCISQNHIVSTLKNYERIIEETEDEEKKAYLKEFYRELFYVNVGLMDDFIYADGNYKMIDCFGDDLSSQSIGLSDIEYAFDKDEQLYEYAKYLIEEVLSYEDSWENNLNVWAAFEFKLLELDDIIKNVSDEHFYELPSLVNENNTYQSANSKKRILKLIKKHE